MAKDSDREDRESPENFNARMGWISGLVLGVIALLGGIAAAVGFVPPGERLTKVELIQIEHESRIQRLEDADEIIRAIAAKVGANVPRRPRRGR